MLGRFALIQGLLGVALLGAPHPAGPAQVVPGPAQTVPGPSPQSKKFSAEAEKLTAKVLGSYYHPDKLPGLECNVIPDWAGFFHSAKVAVPPDSMQAIQALKIHVRAVRDATPEFTFNWAKGRPADAAQIEASLKQIVGGFYEVYWPLFASPAIKYAAVISKIERQPDGSSKVYESDSNAFVVMTVDKDGTPTHYSMQSPAVSGTVDPHYVRPPHPERGDRRRITSVDVSRKMGDSSMHVQVSLDYQPMGGYFVPRDVSYSLVGAYTLNMNFAGCSVTAAAAPAK